MPQEIKDAEKFIQISDRAHYCDIKRVGRVVKLKLRTPGRLYTLKADPNKAEEIVKKLRCEIREVLKGICGCARMCIVLDSEVQYQANRPQV